MIRVVSMIVAFFLSPAGAVRAQERTFPASFERLRALVGEWEGTYQWSGARTGSSGRMNATYTVTGNGSAVVENLTVDNVPTMTSLYHTDGTDLRMTHLCAAQNQPRLKATRIDDEEGVMEFSFVDITNLPSPNAPHVEELEIRFLAEDRIRLTFTFISDAGRSYERIDLVRKA